MTIHARVGEVTERIRRRSHDSRSAYRERLVRARDAGPPRRHLSCGNLAHGFAACSPSDKAKLATDIVPNLGIVTAYNDMLSAHLSGYRVEPKLDDAGNLRWDDSAAASHDPNVLRPAAEPFQPSGGLKLLAGNLGRAVIKISAVKPERHVVEAPAIVFHSQHALMEAFKAGELERDFVAVVRFQGPRANGMPELHKLTPPLGVLQDRGHRVALVTDGRMSGASGKVPAAIDVTPEAEAGGPIARIRDGDMIRVDAGAGRLDVLTEAAEFAAREPAAPDLSANDFGMGRELFRAFRQMAAPAEHGAGVSYGAMQ